MQRSTTEKTIIVGQVVTTIISIALIAVVVYVAYHFITKFW